MFDTLLIANRGEIACRIIKTAKALGIRTVAVYSDADETALHVQMADQSVRLGPAPASESYLRSGLILEAAQKTRANAIHPGYGFLSEQADLVRGCLKHNLVWVGPHLDAISLMGSKIEAKKAALQAGVPCVPGYDGMEQSDEALIAAAKEIGLPVMIKANAGGGGKGMRAVHNEGDLPQALFAARTEAARSFGDGRLLIEKLIQNPRHIEVQLLGDKHGNLVHLFERDCSIQRNHQKLLEEAPAPNLRADTRDALYEAALSLGRRIGYDSTGTVEFIMDAESEAFYFLEMNTRLQVEHTVTEEITGLDLVEHQLRVASGERLAITQDEVACNGHAIETRLTAEDAANGFHPETGTILHWSAPENLRVDSGVATGSTIGASYDAMIAKLVAHGADRELARKKLLRGLEQLSVVGVKTNRLFLRDMLMRERFAHGLATTDFLQQEWPDGWQSCGTASFELAALAFHCQPRDRSSPWKALGSFRLLQASGQPAVTHYLDKDEPTGCLALIETEDGLQIRSDEATIPVAVGWRSSTQLDLTRNGLQEAFRVWIEKDCVYVWGHDFEAMHRVTLLGDFNAAQQGPTSASSDRIIAPVPGLIVAVNVQIGTAVAKGNVLLVMESMKLLMELKADMAGIVQDIKVDVGDVVDANKLLIQLSNDQKED